MAWPDTEDLNPDELNPDEPNVNPAEAVADTPAPRPMEGNQFAAAFGEEALPGEDRASYLNRQEKLVNLGAVGSPTLPGSERERQQGLETNRRVQETLARDAERQAAAQQRDAERQARAADVAGRREAAAGMAAQKKADAGRVKGLKETGVEFQTMPDGSTAPKLHPDGRLVYKKGWSSDPYQDAESGRHVKDYRDEFGNVVPKDMEEQGLVKTMKDGPMAGQKYFKDKGGVDVFVGEDKTWGERKAIELERQAAYQAHAAESNKLTTYRDTVGVKAKADKDAVDADAKPVLADLAKLKNTYELAMAEKAKTGQMPAAFEPSVAKYEAAAAKWEEMKGRYEAAHAAHAEFTKKAIEQKAVVDRLFAEPKALTGKLVALDKAKFNNRGVSETARALDLTAASVSDELKAASDESKAAQEEMVKARTALTAAPKPGQATGPMGIAKDAAARIMGAPKLLEAADAATARVKAADDRVKEAGARVQAWNDLSKEADAAAKEYDAVAAKATPAVSNLRKQQQKAFADAVLDPSLAEGLPARQAALTAAMEAARAPMMEAQARAKAAQTKLLQTLDPKTWLASEEHGIALKTVQARADAWQLATGGGAIEALSVAMGAAAAVHPLIGGMMAGEAMAAMKLADEDRKRHISNPDISSAEWRQKTMEDQSQRIDRMKTVARFLDDRTALVAERNAQGTEAGKGLVGDSARSAAKALEFEGKQIESKFAGPELEAAKAAVVAEKAKVAEFNRIVGKERERAKEASRLEELQFSQQQDERLARRGPAEARLGDARQNAAANAALAEKTQQKIAKLDAEIAAAKDAFGEASPELQKQAKQERLKALFAPAGTELKAWDKAKDLVKNPDQLIPFAHSLPHLAEMAEVYQASKRVQAAIAKREADGTTEPDEDDLATIGAFQRAQSQKTSTGYKIWNTILAMPAFVMEFALTGGIYTAGKTAAIKSVDWVLSKAGTNVVKDLIEKQAARKLAMAIGDTVGAKAAMSGLQGAAVFAGKSVAALAASVPQTAVAAAPAIAADWIEGMAPEIGLGVTKAGELEAVINKDRYGNAQNGKAAWDAGLRAFGKNYVEVFTEHSGGAIAPVLSAFGKTVGAGAAKVLGAMPEAARAQVVKLALMKAWVSKKAGRTVGDFAAVLDKGGFHGIASEIGEEYFGDAVRLVADTIDNKLQGPDAQTWKQAFAPAWEENKPTLEKLGIMGASFAPMTIMHGVSNQRAERKADEQRAKMAGVFAQQAKVFQDAAARLTAEETAQDAVAKTGGRGASPENMAAHAAAQEAMFHPEHGVYHAAGEAAAALHSVSQQTKQRLGAVLGQPSAAFDAQVAANPNLVFVAGELGKIGGDAFVAETAREGAARMVATERGHGEEGVALGRGTVEHHAGLVVADTLRGIADGTATVSDAKRYALAQHAVVPLVTVRADGKLAVTDAAIPFLPGTMQADIRAGRGDLRVERVPGADSNELWRSLYQEGRTHLAAAAGKITAAGTSNAQRPTPNVQGGNAAAASTGGTWNVEAVDAQGNVASFTVPGGNEAAARANVAKRKGPGWTIQKITPVAVDGGAGSASAVGDENSPASATQGAVQGAAQGKGGQGAGASAAQDELLPLRNAGQAAGAGAGNAGGAAVGASGANTGSTSGSAGGAKFYTGLGKNGQAGKRLAALERAGVKVIQTNGFTLARLNADGTTAIEINPAAFQNDAHAEAAVGEEIIHHFDNELMAAEWKKAVADGTFQGDAQEYRAERVPEILHDLRSRIGAIADPAERKAASDAVVAAFNLYYGRLREDAPLATTVEQALRMIADGLDIEGTPYQANVFSYAMELKRMLDQARQNGIISEETHPVWGGKIGAWVRDAIAAIKALAAKLLEMGHPLHASEMSKLARDAEALMAGTFAKGGTDVGGEAIHKVLAGGETIATGGAWASKNPRGKEMVRGTWALVPLRVLGINKNFGTDQDRINREQTGAAQRAEIVANMTEENIPSAWGASNTLNDGSPIITPDGSVIIGNNRTMALRDIYNANMGNAGRARSYEDYARAEAARQGLDGQAFAGEPVVLVRVVSDAAGLERGELVKAANKAGVAAKSEADMAIEHAALLDDDALMSQLSPGEDGSLNREFLQAFARSLADRDPVKDSKGNLDLGKAEKLAGNAMLAALLRGAKNFEQVLSALVTASGREGMKRTMAGVFRALPGLLKVQKFNPASGILHELGRALAALPDYRAAVADGRVKNVGDYLAQKDLFESPLEGKLLGYLAEGHSAAEIAKELGDYVAKVVAQGDPAQDQMFAAPAVDKGTMGGVLAKMIEPAPGSKQSRDAFSRNIFGTEYENLRPRQRADVDRAVGEKVSRKVARLNALETLERTGKLRPSEAWEKAALERAFGQQFIPGAEGPEFALDRETAVVELKAALSDGMVQMQLLAKPAESLAGAELDEIRIPRSVRMTERTGHAIFEDWVHRDMEKNGSTHAEALAKFSFEDAVRVARERMAPLLAKMAEQPELLDPSGAPGEGVRRYTLNQDRQMPAEIPGVEQPPPVPPAWARHSGGETWALQKWREDMAKWLERYKGPLVFAPADPSRERVGFVSKTPSNGKWRLTHFQFQQPSGHTDYGSKVDALEDAIRYYRRVDPGAVFAKPAEAAVKPMERADGGRSAVPVNAAADLDTRFWSYRPRFILDRSIAVVQKVLAKLDELLGTNLTRFFKLKTADVVFMVKPLGKQLGGVEKVRAFLRKHGGVIAEEWTGIVDAQRIAEHYKNSAGKAFFPEMVKYMVGREVTAFRVKVDGSKIPELRKLIGDAQITPSTLRAEIVEGSTWKELYKEHGALDNGLHLSDSFGEGARESNVWFGIPPIVEGSAGAVATHKHLWNTLKKVCPSIRFGGSAYNGTAVPGKMDDLDYMLLAPNVEAMRAAVAKIPGLRLETPDGAVDPTSGTKYYKFEYDFPGGKADIAVVDQEAYRWFIHHNALAKYFPEQWKQEMIAEKKRTYDAVSAAESANGKASAERKAAKAAYESVKRNYYAQVRRFFRLDELWNKSLPDETVPEAAVSARLASLPEATRELAVRAIAQLDPKTRGHILKRALTYPMPAMPEAVRAAEQAPPAPVNTAVAPTMEDAGNLGAQILDDLGERAEIRWEKNGAVTESPKDHFRQPVNGYQHLLIQTKDGEKIHVTTPEMAVLRYFGKGEQAMERILAALAVEETGGEAAAEAKAYRAMIGVSLTDYYASGLLAQASRTNSSNLSRSIWTPLLLSSLNEKFGKPGSSNRLQPKSPNTSYATGTSGLTPTTKNSTSIENSGSGGAFIQSEDTENAQSRQLGEENNRADAQPMAKRSEPAGQPSLFDMLPVKAAAAAYVASLPDTKPAAVKKAAVRDGMGEHADDLFDFAAKQQAAEPAGEWIEATMENAKVGMAIRDPDSGKDLGVINRVFPGMSGTLVTTSKRAANGRGKFMLRGMEIFQPKLTGTQQTSNLSNNETSDRNPASTHGRPSAQSSPSGALDDLFSLMAGKREAERGAGTSERAGGDGAAVGGRADVGGDGIRADGVSAGKATGSGQRGGSTQAGGSELGGRGERGGTGPRAGESADGRGGAQADGTGGSGARGEVEAPGGSVVKAEVYHQTPHDVSVSGFKPFSHFGSKAAAESVWSNWKKDVWEGAADPKLRVHKVRLNIQNPIRLVDEGQLTSAPTWAGYLRHELVKRGFAEDVPATTEGDYGGVDEEHWPKLVAEARRAGIDGIVYDNQGEGGGDSYVILDPAQVIPVDGAEASLPPLVERPTDPDARNFVIPRGATIAPRGLITKLKANIKAVKLLKAIQGERRNATAEEKAALVQFTGWGALSQAFDEDKAGYVAAGHLERDRKDLARYQEMQQRDIDAGRTGEYYKDLVDRSEEKIRGFDNWQKKWGGYYAQIKEALTEPEWRRARASTINAHFTEGGVVSLMWDAVGRLGFRGGNVGEMALGIGHFYGLMPQELQDRSKLFGVEMDPVSAGIAQLLYPEADIQNSAFQQADVADNSLDLNMGNVPFANIAIKDPAIKALDGPLDNLHDYYFAKMLQKTRPGGLICAISSAFTLDKMTATNRKWLAERADLVAAFRLPNDAFKENAGTDVVTDIIILRKKDGQPFEHGQAWTSLAESRTAKGEPIRVNEYFAAHPQNVLGLLADDGEMFGGREGDKEMTVHSDPVRPADVALAQAIDALPADIVGAGAGTNVRGGAAAANSLKMGNIVKAASGHYHFNTGGEFSPEGMSESDAELNDPKNRPRVAGFIGVRDALNRQYELELSPTATEADIEENRAELNRLYDAFKGRFEDFHHKANKGLFIDDPDYFRLAGAEMEEKSKGGIKALVAMVRGKAAKKYVKADVFRKRVLAPRVEPTRADSLEDAMGMSLGWRGRVDTGYIAQLTGQTREQVEAALLEREIVLRDPSTGQIQSREQYLSGNVRKKLEIARASGEEFARNVRLLETAQPADVAMSDIKFTIGATWIPAETYREFMQSLGLDVTITYTTAGGGADRWTVEHPTRVSVDSVRYKDFEAGRFNADSMLDAMLNMRRIEVRDSARDGGKVNPALTAQAVNKSNELKAEFERWARDTPGVADKLAGIYNREVNGFALRTYDGQHLTFPWASNDFNIFPDKKNTVWRAIQEGFGLIAHGVGGGKTIVGSSIALELRRLGLAKKPMIVVHNATLEQFADTIAQIAPAARVLVGRKDELQGAKRKEFLMRIAAGDWDAVVVAHSTFNLIADDPAFMRKQMENLVDELKEALMGSGYKDLGAAKDDRKKNASVKQMVKMVEELEAKITEASRRTTDSDLLSFQQLGVDALVVDEVHKFKKMPFATKLDVKGIDGGMSKSGYGLLMRARGIQEKAGGKNVFTMTGTPVTNTLGEVWNQVRLVAPHLLKEYGIEKFDQFVSKFATVESKSEADPTGARKMVERLAKIINLPEWATFFRMAADVKFGEDMVTAGRPDVKGGKPELVAAERTKGATAWVNYIRQVLTAFKEIPWKEKQENPALMGVPVTAYMASRAAAIDIRLIEPRAKDEPGSKVNLMIERAMGIYKQTGEYKGTQVIFADAMNPTKVSLFDQVVPLHGLGIPLDPTKEPGTTFHLYDDIRMKLIKRGVPESQIAVLTDKKYQGDSGEKAKKALWEKVNAGEVRFVLGSTEKLGTGVNMQRLMAAAHHLDVPWTPAGLEQRDGRVLRQGNLHMDMKIPIELIRYGMKDTLDEALWGILERKQRFITSALSGKLNGREIEEDEMTLSLGEQMAILSGPYGQEMFEVDNRLRELEYSRQAHAASVRRRDAEILESKKEVRTVQAEKDANEPKFKKLERLAAAVAKDGAQLTVDGETFDTKKAMLEAVNRVIEEARADYEGKVETFRDMPVPVITSIVANGVPIRLTGRPFTQTVYGEEQTPIGERMALEFALEGLPWSQKNAGSDHFGEVKSAGTLLSRLDELGGRVQARRDAIQRNLERYTALANMDKLGAWPYQAEFDRKTARAAELVRLMQGSGQTAEGIIAPQSTPLLAKPAETVDDKGGASYAETDTNPLSMEDVQAYLDFANVPPANQAEAQKAIGRVKKAPRRKYPLPAAGGMDRGVEEQRKKQAAVYRGLAAGDAATVKQGIADGVPVSSLMAQFIRRDIPGFDIRGAVIERPEDVAAFVAMHRTPFFESSKILVLDGNNQVIHSQLISVGALNETFMGQREVTGVIEQTRRLYPDVPLAGFILSHNHPSGDPTPSGADIKMTGILEQTGTLIGVPLLDHVVTNGRSHYSFREMGHISGATTVKETKALRQPRLPVPERNLADWEAIGAGAGRISIQGTHEVAAVTATLKTADPDHLHVLIADTKMKLIAVNRYPLNAPMGEIARDVAAAGGYGAILSMPSSITAPVSGRFSQSESGLLQKFSTAMKITGVRPVDVVSANDFSAAAAGLVGETTEQSTPLLAKPAEGAGDLGKLVMDNLGLAVSIARGYSNVTAPMEDVVSEARLALVKAARGWQPDKGPFGNYAARAIRNALNSMFTGEGAQARAEVATLDAETGRQEDGETGETWKDNVSRNGADEVTRPIEDRETREGMQAAIAKLPEYPRSILFGLMEGRTMEDIAEEKGVSKQAISKVAQTARAAVKAIMQRAGFKGVDSDGVLLAKPVQTASANDAEYMDAVKRGDMETAQRMVDEAAKAAGYDVGPLWHGGAKVTSYQTPLFLSPYEKVSESYRRNRAFDGGDTATQRMFARAKNPAGDADVLAVAKRLGIEGMNEEDSRPHEFLSVGMIGADQVNRVITELKKQGFDSAHTDGDFSMDDPFSEYDSWTIFDPSQVKSADPVTRDASGAVIPLSQRFNPESNSILMAKPVQTASVGAGQGMSVGGVLVESALDQAQIAREREATLKKLDPPTPGGTMMPGEKLSVMGDIYSFLFKGWKDAMERGAPGTKDAVDAGEIRAAKAAAATREMMERMLADARAGLDAVHGGKGKALFKQFAAELLPTASRLNATGVDVDGNPTFSTFDQRAGIIFKNQAEASGVTTGQWLERGTEFLKVGNYIEDAGGYQLLRELSPERQQKIYDTFMERFNGAGHYLTLWISPDMADARVTDSRGTVLPEFNRHALRKFFGEVSPHGELDAVEGYVPEIQRTRSLAGMIGQGVTNLLNKNFKSGAREYKSGQARETGEVKNLFEGFAIRAMEAHAERSRREMAERLIPLAVKDIPAVGGVPSGWMAVNTHALPQLAQAYGAAMGMSKEQLVKWTNAVATQDMDALRKLCGKAWQDLTGNKMMRKEVFAALVRPMAATESGSAIMRFFASMTRAAVAAFLVRPSTAIMNMIGNEVFKGMRLIQQAQVSLLLRKADPQAARVSASEAWNLTKGIITNRWFNPARRRMMDAVAPMEYSEGNSQIAGAAQSMTEAKMTAWEHLKQANVPAALLKLTRFGEMDPRAKQQLQFASLIAHAEVAAEDAEKQGFKFANRKQRMQWMQAWLAKQPDDLMVQARAVGLAYAMDYDNVPWWLDPGHRFAVGTVDMTPVVNVARNLMLPYMRWTYNYLRNTKRWLGGGSADVVTWLGAKVASAPFLAGTEAGKRMKAAAEERGVPEMNPKLAHSIANLGTFVLMQAAAYAILHLGRGGGDDDKDRVDRLGRSFDQAGKRMDRAFDTSSRMDISDIPVLGTATRALARMFGEQKDGDSYWLRTRQIPYASVLLATATSLDALGADKAHARGLQTEAANMWREFAGDLVSEGILMTVVNKVRGNESKYTGSQSVSTTLGGMATDFALARVAPQPLLSMVRDLVDPQQRRLTPNEKLGYDPGVVEGVKSRLPFASKTLPPAGKIKTKLLDNAVEELAQVQAKGHTNATAFGVNKDGKPTATFVDPADDRRLPRWKTLLGYGLVNIKPVDKAGYERAVHGEEGDYKREMRKAMLNGKR